MFELIENAASRIRRNHGLEHATLHILARHFPKRSLAGYSDVRGFWLVGDVPTEAVTQAVWEAHGRMRAGETNLAVHPNCGTNFVVAGALAGLAGFAGMFTAGKGVRDKLERLPLLASLATLAIIMAQPLGYRLQERVTTSGDMSSLEVISIGQVGGPGLPAHRIITRG